jgi:hypothetical protein
MRGNSFAYKAVKLGVFIVIAGTLGLTGILQCTRSNPIDPRSDDYIPNTDPLAGFVGDTISCLATDSVQITVFWSDTQALGGKTPAVTMLWFNWDGDSSLPSMTEFVAVSGAGPVVLTRAFPAGRDVFAYVRAVDNDNKLGPAAWIRLIVAAPVLPEARFTQDTVSGFIRDSIPLTVAYSDTQAYGGKTPAVTMLYLNWTGDSSVAAVTDSAAVYGSGSITLDRYFTTPRNTMVYVRALDNDGQLSPAAGVRLIVDEGQPAITVPPVTAPQDSVLTGDTLTVTVGASDTNGSVADYVWTVLGSDMVTTDSVLKFTFPLSAVGTQTIYVRVVDDDGVESPRDSVTIFVVPRIDTTGPAVQFISPLDNDTVSTSIITVTVQAGDPSGVLLVYVNNNAATRISGTEILGMYQRQNVTLDTGANDIVVWSMDNHPVNHSQSRDTLHVTYQKPDNTPPAIAFSYPMPLDTVYQSPVSVAVTVTDQSGVAWVLCGPDTMANPSGSIYTSDVALVEGMNPLVITARDTRGNTILDTLDFAYVIRDKTPPVVQIIAPLPGARIVPDSVLVSVIATDTGAYASGIASVTVNGLPATSSLGVYSLTIPLDHGDNSILVVATDASPVANQTADSVAVVQNAPPRFVPDTAVKDTALWVDSAALIGLCAADDDADPVGFSFVTTPSKSSSYGITGTGSCVSLSYTPDSAGADSFYVQVADSIYGDADTILVRITNTMPDYTPPSITFVTPSDGDTVIHSPVTVVVTVTDPSGVAWVLCGSDTMVNTSGSSYQADITLIEGANALVISAADTRENGAADTLHITCVVFHDSTPPAVTIVAPQPLQRIAATTVEVQVTASDSSGIDSVLINDTAATYAAPVWRRTVALVHGYDTIVVAAVDASPAHNRTADTVIVIQNVQPNFVPNVAVKDTNLWLDTLSTIPVCASDPEGDAVTFSFLTMPLMSSTVPSIVPAGPGCVDITGYTPVTTGLDTFRVRAVDAWGGADTLKLSVTIIDRGSLRPYFTISTLPDTALLDSLYSVLLTAEDPAGNLPLTFSLDYSVTPAAVAVDGVSGQLTWTPDALGPDTIRAIVTNTLPESDTLEWYVTVVLPDMPPVFAHRNDTSVNEGQTLQFAVFATDTNNDALRYSFGSSCPAGASLDSVTGVFSWTPGYRQAGVYALGFIVVERDRVPALSDTDTVVVTVVNVNNPPVLVNPGDKTVNETKTLTIVLQAGDVNGDSITYAVAGAPGAGIVNGNQFTWTPTASQGGVYPVSFFAFDNGTPVMSDTESITVTVADTTVPVFDPHAPLDTAYVGMTYATAVHAVDPDGDRIFYARLNGPAGLTVHDSLGTVNWTPTSADAGTTVFIEVTAADPAGRRDTVSWSVTVLEPDYPPELLNPGDRNVTEGQIIQFTLFASDQNNDTLRFTFGSTPPAGAALDSVTGVFTWVPGYRQSGAYPVVFKVYERDRVPVLSDTAIITIAVKDTNHAPVLSYPPDGASFVTYEKVNISFTLTATDQNGDTLFYSMAGAPSGALLVNKNVFTWTPTEQQARSTPYAFSFVVADTGNPAMADTAQVSITVRDTTVPKFVPDSRIDTVYVETPYTYTVHVVDSDSDRVDYEVISGPDSLLIDEKFGIITWKPKYGDIPAIQPMAVAITATDHYGNRDTFNLTLFVLPRWPRTYLYPATGDTGFSVIQTTNGNYAVCGSVGDSAFFMRTDTSGNRLMFRKYGSTSRASWSANCIRQTSDGGFILCGTDTMPTGVSRLLLIRLKADGDTLWTRQYLPALSQYSSLSGASVAVVGEQIVACGTAFNRGGVGFACAMYAMEVIPATGERLWEKVYYTGIVSTGNGSLGFSIRPTGNKGFILAGEINNGGNIGTGVYLVKTNQVGDTTWTRVYRFQTGSLVRNVGFSVAESVDQSLYVCGTVVQGVTGGSSALVFRTTPAGDTLWRWQGSGAVATGVRATADGGCIASGYRLSGTIGGNDALLMKFTVGGALSWSPAFGTVNDDRAYDVNVNAKDGGYVFTGFTTNGATLNADIYLVRTDDRGAVIH